MYNLLSLEYKKFRKNSVVSVLTLFYFLFLPAGLLILKQIDYEGLPAQAKLFLPSPDSFFQFPNIWEYLGYVGNWMVFFFLGVVVITMISAEVQYKTQRQTIINGMERNTYFKSKMLVVLAISLVATLYYCLIAMGVGMFTTEDWDIAYMFDNKWAILRYFLMCVGYLSFAAFIAFLLKKPGLASFLYLSYAIMIEPLLKVLLKTKDIIPGEYGNYLPLNAIEDLMPFPLYRYEEYLPKNLNFEFLLTNSAAIITSVIFILLFNGITFRIFKKRDL